MLGFLVDNVYVVFGDQVLQQSVGIRMGTNCAPFLADLFLYSYQTEFVQKLSRDTPSKVLPFLSTIQKPQPGRKSVVTGGMSDAPILVLIFQIVPCHSNRHRVKALHNPADDRTASDSRKNIF
jgi:hypothetical protein